VPYEAQGAAAEPLAFYAFIPVSKVPMQRFANSKRANSKRLGFFTRLLDDAAPAERYRLAAEQIMHAETADPK
jgi:hypothetical protein